MLFDDNTAFFLDNKPVLLAVLTTHLNLTPSKMELVKEYYSDWMDGLEDGFCKLPDFPNQHRNNWIKQARHLNISKIQEKTNRLKIALDKNDIQILTFEDVNYPKTLFHLTDYPLIIFYHGQMVLLNDLSNMLTVVGSRQVQPYTKNTLQSLLGPVCQSGIGTISGLALGTDALAHQIAIDNGVPTIAVIGSGLDEDSFYPQQNLRLRKEILNSGGLILSEYPPGTRATQYSFPKRNRLLAALSGLTLVMQASMRSGSLITAREALDIGRTVATIPAQINQEIYSGNIKLLKEGAQLISHADDILSLMPKVKRRSKPLLTYPAFDNELEKQVFEYLQRQEDSYDNISKAMHVNGQELSGILTILEMKGLIFSSGDNLWSVS